MRFLTVFLLISVTVSTVFAERRNDEAALELKAKFNAKMNRLSSEEIIKMRTLKKKPPVDNEFYQSLPIIHRAY